MHPLFNSRRRLASTRIRPAALAVFALCAAAAARAQDTPEAPVQRVEVTGSSIKRLAGETALPVQTISREDIAKAGVTTAAELLKTLSANTAPLSDGASITDGTSGQRGFNGANLRGIGVSSTLVLLNGRRLANFASPGDSAGVDLNNIPAGALQRVEVLKDGASAIYGADAIGGVINFITRRDYEGLDLGLYASATQEGGAGKRTATLSGGAGNLAKDRFNLFGVVDVQQLDALSSKQRKFIQERPLATLLPALMSSSTYPANVDISAAQRDALISAGLLPAGSTGRRINPSSPTCNDPATVYAPDGPGGPLGCSYDYMKDTQIYPESKRIGFLGRATLQLAEEHQLYAELLQSDTRSRYVLSPNPIRIRNVPVSVLPPAYRDALTGAGLPATVSGIRYRMAEAGNRTDEVTSDAQRVVLGATGALAGWDYDTAISRAQNRATDKFVHGYVLYDQFVAGVDNASINPFGASSQPGLDLLTGIEVNDSARRSRGVTEAVDAKITRALTALAGGDLELALGGEFRRETEAFNPSALLISNNIAGDRDSGSLAGSSTALAATSDSRKVAAVYAELSAPINKQLELQLAARYDRYSAIGGTTNPKLGLRWQPSKQVLVRASANTGFRAPSLDDLHRPTTYGTTASLLTDPECVAQGGSIDGCTDQWPVERRSNAALKPERSRQFSLGAVVEPMRDFTFNLDYWNIQVRDVISALGEQIIIASPAKYDGTYITRDGDGNITNILLHKENQGRLRTSGIDIGADFHGPATEVGRFSASINGTLVLQYQRQFGPQESYRSNLGVFLNDQVIQRWRHRLNLDWDFKDVGLTLSNSYSSGYADQNSAYDPVTNTPLESRRVRAYSLWDLSGRWNATKSATVRAGVQNLFNTDPPYSNQSYYFLATYDPTYTDPRGRTGYVALDYKFR
jgi:iron complex outermembrane receptor protein